MTTDTVGGVWTYALELARALLPHEVEVVLATMGRPPTPEQTADATSVRNILLHVSQYKLEWMNEPWEDVERAGEWLLDIERREQPDLVHLNGYVHGSLDWSAPCLIVGHSCVLSWWKAVKGEPAPAEWERYRQRVRKGLQAARLVMSPTRAMLATLERWYGPLSDTCVTPNAGNCGLFRPARKEQFIFSAGRIWDEAKNVLALERVAPRLAWRVYVAGEERHPETGSVALDDVHYLGQLSPSKLAQWYGRAAIYALPARYEPFGLTALEAGLSGCALVLGDIESLREVWGDAALFVPPDGHVALERTINGLAADRKLLEEMSQRAISRARLYTPERMTKTYLRAISESMGLAPRGSEVVRL